MANARPSQSRVVRVAELVGKLRSLTMRLARLANTERPEMTADAGIDREWEATLIELLREVVRASRRERRS
ncbi:MAG TPA: hypothetical protein VJ891_16915 [Casimicrobiaceae bacterium]|nr:hypothetical protein [Casimicrobiaceae bacterium]